MKKLLLTTFIISVACFSTKSQTWEKLFSGLSTDVIRSVREVPAGGYIIAGYTANLTSNDTDAYVARLNTSGDTLWTYTYNGPLSKKDLFYKVIPTSDGGFALCGYTSSVTGTSDDAMYMKLNSSGQQQWVKFYGGSQKERAQDIIETTDGGFAIVGYTTSSPAQYYDAFFLKTNSVGVVTITKLFGSSNYDDANAVREMPDGGFILGGQSSNGTNGFDMFLVRIGPTGSTYWMQRFGTMQTENIESLLILSDGFIVAGNTNTAATGDDGYIVKTDTSGIVVWSKSYGGSQPDDFHRVEPTSDGGYVAIGTTSSTGPAFPNMWMMKTNSTGDSLWSKAFGGANHDHGYSGQQTSDGGYIIAGHTGSFGFNYEDGYVIKTDASGNNSTKLTYTTVLDIITPSTITCANASTPIKLVLRNFGNQSIANIPVTVQVTGAITTTINQTFSAGSDTVTLSTTLNTSGGGTFNIAAFTNNNNSVYPARNSMSRSVTIEVTPSAPSPTSNSRCGNGSVALSATASSTIYWYTSSSGGASVFSGTLYNTPSLSATTTYYVQTGVNCPSARLAVVATVNPQSANPVTTGNSRCGAGTVTLTATSSDPVTWYNAATGGSIVGTGLSFTTPSISATTNYYALASNGLCPSSRVLTLATVNSGATAPTVISNQRCGTGAVTLTASSPDPIIWFDASTGGTQVGVGSTFVTPSISTTTTYWAEADNGCQSNRIAATATILPKPANPVPTAGEKCGQGTVSLSATATNPIKWYDVATGGTQIGSGVSFNTPVITMTTTFYAEANDGTCSSNRVPVSAVIHTLPSVYLGADTTVNGSTYLLNAGNGFASYNWSTGSTSQTINVSNTNTYCVTVTDANNCTNTDCILVDLITGIQDIINQTSFVVYPNPTSGVLFIEFNNPASITEVSIINLTGQTLLKTNADNSALLKLNLSAFTSGIYLLKLQTNESSTIRKFIKY